MLHGETIFGSADMIVVVLVQGAERGDTAHVLFLSQRGNLMSASCTIAIRPLVESDREPWSRLWKGYLEYYKTQLPETVYTSSFARMLEGNAGAANEFRGLLATIDDTPKGLVHFIYHRHGWKLENVCYLQDLYVDPTVRGIGLGRRLIEAVYAQADFDGAPSVYWLTQDFNTAGRQLYDRVGMLTPFIKYARP